jgi:hypothetical protein
MGPVHNLLIFFGDKQEAERIKCAANKSPLKFSPDGQLEIIEKEAVLKVIYYLNGHVEPVET